MKILNIRYLPLNQRLKIVSFVKNHISLSSKSEVDIGEVTNFEGEIEKDI